LRRTLRNAPLTQNGSVSSVFDNSVIKASGQWRKALVSFAAVAGGGFAMSFGGWAEQPSFLFGGMLLAIFGLDGRLGDVVD